MLFPASAVNFCGKGFFISYSTNSTALGIVVISEGEFHVCSLYFLCVL